MLGVDVQGRSPSVNQHLTLSIFPCTQQKWGIINIHISHLKGGLCSQGRYFSVKLKPNDGYYLYNSPFQRQTLHLHQILDIRMRSKCNAKDNAFNLIRGKTATEYYGVKTKLTGAHVSF